MFLFVLFLSFFSQSIWAKEQNITNEVQEFYQTQEMKFIWFRGSGDFQPRVDAAIKILENSWTHGLNPKNYDIDFLKSYKNSDPSLTRTDIEMRLSGSVLRYMNDMTSVRGADYSADKKTKYWRAPIINSDVLVEFEKASNPVKIIESVAPSGKLYNTLRDELMSLMDQPESKGFKKIKPKQPMKVGKTYPEIAEIRTRLGLLPSSDDINFYDESLAVEVMRLQKLKGLETDGVISGRTLGIINMSRDDKLAQVMVNMERIRWMEEGRPEKYVIVNIPSANLWAVDKGEVTLEMPVIIGKTARPTISFKTDISGVRFNPNWTVPKTIKNDDFLPALQSDPLALTKKGIAIYYGGDLVDPTSVDWTKVTSRGMGNLRIVQDSGDSNPLGKVRVIMQNPFDIYLHDTNHREAFDANDRALSSGCIRVAQPEKLADFILAKNDGWSWGEMEKIIASGKMRDVPAKEKIPVYIVYQTVWLNDDGGIIYGNDVYGQDKKLFNSLKNKDSLPISQ